MFTITITETRTTDKVVYEYKEITEGKYGYVEHPTKREDVTRNVLLQQVDEIDLPAVIKAINKL